MAGPVRRGKPPVAPTPWVFWSAASSKYFTQGSLSLYAEVNVKSGRLLGQPAARRTSTEFAAFLAELVAMQPRDRQIQITAAKHSPRKSKTAAQLFADSPDVHLHLASAYSSWLNQVGI